MNKLEKKRLANKKYFQNNKEKIYIQRSKYCKEYNKEYHKKNKHKINKDIKNNNNKIYYNYSCSWGGDKRYNNNLLCINLDIFNN